MYVYVVFDDYSLSKTKTCTTLNIQMSLQLKEKRSNKK